MRFDIKKYSGKYAMRCRTEEDAGEFTQYLHKQGKNWISGISYLSHCPHLYGSNTCYAVNGGTHGTVESYQTLGYVILDFDDFDWGNDITPTENDVKIMDEFFSGFAIC